MLNVVLIKREPSGGASMKEEEEGEEEGSWYSGVQASFHTDSPSLSFISLGSASVIFSFLFILL